MPIQNNKECWCNQEGNTINCFQYAGKGREQIINNDFSNIQCISESIVECVMNLQIAITENEEDILNKFKPFNL